MLWIIHVIIWLSVSVNETRFEKMDSKIIVTSYLNPLAGTSGRTFNVGLMEKELLEILAQSLNFEFEVHPPKDFYGLGIYENGSWTGIIGQLLRGEADLSMSSGEMTPSLNRIVDGTIAVLYDEIKILTSFPETTVSGSSALIQIFSTQVWIGVVFTTMLLITVYWCSSRMQIRPMKISMVEVTLHIFGLLMGQRDYDSKRSSVIRLLCGPWCLAMLVLTSIYRGTLTSMLTAPKFQFVVNSIEDVARNEEIMPYIWKYSPAHQFIMNSPLAACQIIRERIKKHPDLLKVKDDFVSTVLANKNNVFIGSSYLLDHLVSSNAHQTKKCQVAIAKKPVASRKMSLLVRKNSPLTKPINDELSKLYDMGIFVHSSRKYLPPSTSCGDPERKERSKGTKLTQLNFKQLTGAFTILYIGLSTAFFVFIFELCIQRYQRRTRIIKVQRRNPTGTLKSCMQRLRALLCQTVVMAKNKRRKVASQGK